MQAGPAIAKRLRQRASELLGADTCPEGKVRDTVRRCLLPSSRARLQLPATVGDYTDFYASEHHARNVGRLFRPDNPLLPNYSWLPIGYHGRASSLVCDCTPVRRPRGQYRPPGNSCPVFAPTAALDFELEVGAFVGSGNQLGTPIPLSAAEGHLFGFVLLNDWSARDIQAWEYQPLGPFLGKSFATTVSPWVVTADAMLPFRTETLSSSTESPLLPHLAGSSHPLGSALDIKLEVHLLTPRMRAAGVPPHRLARGNLSTLRWTFAQMVTHHTSNGCNLRPGDLLGSGTVSGPTDDSLGCLLEMTRGGTEPVSLPNGETRRYLEDGDEIILRGWCERPGFRRIGFGECRGTVLPALPG